MKKYIIVLMSFFIFISCVSKMKETVKLKEKENELSKVGKFEIVKMDSIDNIYLLYARRNDSIIKIVSMKQINNNCKKIRIGNYYSLKIKSFFGDNFHQKLDIKGVKVSNTVIKLEGNEVIWDLFSSQNLSGQCYTE
ncbi:hypothetical protein [Flavobacterium hercynium]|uniref:Lipoprotein n=1 Tax=Flavobacterium hercynium TaxID=387094 RepID=A0A226H6Z7_9FLAO|nr:hypothetical protein [Flavobacterium hercynium]OXA89972.1 hypothetical protein B0A66_13270 [Flavobacterium hercynium]